MCAVTIMNASNCVSKEHDNNRRSDSWLLSILNFNKAYHGWDNPLQVSLYISFQDELASRLGLCSLSEFEEGLIGKLQILQSGAARLVLGNSNLEVSLGTPASFLQVRFWMGGVLVELSLGTPASFLQVRTQGGMIP